MNIASNPFSTKYWTPGALPFRFEDGCDLDSLAAALWDAKRAQIVGPHGSGKSTLLESLAKYFTDRGHVVCRATLNERQTGLPASFFLPSREPSSLMIVDGFERLSYFRKILFFARCRKKTDVVLLTSHRPVSGVPVLYRTSPRFDLFERLVRRLTETASISFEESILREIFERCGGNFRTAFFELYDLASDQFQTESKMDVGIAAHDLSLFAESKRTRHDANH